MDLNKHKNKLWIVVVAVVVAVLAVAAFFGVGGRYQPPASKHATGQTLPADAKINFFYFGSGVRLIHFTQQQQGDVTRLISDFYSGRTVTEDVANYESLFKDIGWIYTPNINNTDVLANMYATNKDESQWVNIKIAKNGAGVKAKIFVVYSIKKLSQ